MVERIRHPQKLGDRLHDADACELSLVTAFEGWPDDLERLHGSLTEHLGCDWELVVVDLPVDDDGSERIATLGRVRHVPLRDRLGWSACRNLGLRLATGRLVAVVDTSVELTGDVCAGLSGLLEERSVGLVGRWGVVTADGFEYATSEGPDVDGVEAYLMATRRSMLTEVGLFHPKFRWYRNADLDFSFKVRDAGYRTVVDPTLPLRRHEHRLWANTPSEEREALSRKNFFRFRDHWGDRADLLVGGR